MTSHRKRARSERAEANMARSRILCANRGSLRNTAVGKDMWLAGRSTRFMSESGPLAPSLVTSAAPSPSPSRAETGSSGAATPRGWAGSQRGAWAPLGWSADVPAGNSAFPLQDPELCRRPSVPQVWETQQLKKQARFCPAVAPPPGRSDRRSASSQLYLPGG